MDYIVTILWRTTKIVLLWSFMVPIVTIAATWQIASGKWDGDPLVGSDWWKELWE